MSHTRAKLCKVFFISLVLYSATWQLPLFGLIIQKCFLKKFLYFFVRTFPEKLSYIFYKKVFFNFQEVELSYIFLKKVFLIFLERYIQDPGTFRTLAISAMEYFAKIAT